ncbi:histidine-containing phosphotransfer protein 4 [Phtheirospermum japonicum]|uniref:Histidine-containing phosphotransfer protein n=1 Tax=Phtheirospermum japonicum TaxID=374723 RepID=A0A830D539_9LAMI|nr:histidine-containing phosphotransfer protein 4 [Phtheirospermum japonicum]
MKGNQLQRRAAYIRNSLFDQGYLDEQFVELEDLQDEANPTFVEEVVKLFYTDSARFIQNIEATLSRDSRPLDFEKLDDIMHQFKGSSSSIGAKKVKKECTQFQEYCKVGSFEGYFSSISHMQEDIRRGKTGACNPEKEARELFSANKTSSLVRTRTTMMPNKKCGPMTVSIKVKAQQPTIPPRLRKVINVSRPFLTIPVRVKPTK